MKKSVLIIVLFLILTLVDLSYVLISNPNLIGNISLDLLSEDETVTEEKIVTKIIDGDTVIIEGGESVRLLGIDCDEKGKKCYNIAKKRIEELLLGKKVILERDIENKDQYGRYLRYIILDNENIDAKMVKEGYCVARFQGDSKYKTEIQNAESYAISNKIGCKWESN
ncbi:MAG TPA: thermonuclease family protein [Candidatus Paceibacterota bacterium]|nr:thermonuclease family protein [Candidatus Paceibacterota bacterium]